MYKWRLDRLLNDEASFKKEDKFKNKDIKKIMPYSSNVKGVNSSSNVELVIASERYFLVLT
jgi:hypothetical protein